MSDENPRADYSIWGSERGVKLLDHSRLGLPGVMIAVRLADLKLQPNRYHHIEYGNMELWVHDEIKAVIVVDLDEDATKVPIYPINDAARAHYRAKFPAQYALPLPPY